MSTSHLLVVMLSGLNMCRSCTSCHNCCKFTRALLCLENSFLVVTLLLFLESFRNLLNGSRTLRGKSMMKIALVLLYGMCSRGKIPSAINTVIIGQYRLLRVNFSWYYKIDIWFMWLELFSILLNIMLPSWSIFENFNGCYR